MSEQIVSFKVGLYEAIRRTAEQPNVTIQIMPSRAGYHSGLAGPFVLWPLIRTPEEGPGEQPHPAP